MMAYDNQFVLAIMHNGSPVREITGKVVLPFNSEYKIRLKNKHSYLRAKARVWVDGRKASNLGDFILKPGETLDLERFLDESMTSGRCFKFVPLSDRRVNDPTDEENGIIKVEFYRELDWANRIVVDPWSVKPITPGPYGGRGSTGRLSFDWNINTSPTTFEGAGSESLCSNSIQSSVNYLSSPGQSGATVEGGHSGQKFVEGADFSTEIYPVTLRLKIQGPKKKRPEHLQEESGFKFPRKPKPKKVRYCSECGARRMRGANFCHRCGQKYPKYLK